MERRERSWGGSGDAALAMVMACLMTAAWTWRNWPMLSVLHLPDTDDVMRLQQIRDWLGGQSFADLTQHRLGPVPGLQMHWSRLADLVPAAIITALATLTGQHNAELIAVIAWPALLLTCALFLIASIARRVEPHGEPATAIIIAAIAYPATTIFMPGRIDHHGSQIVLLLGVMRALMARPSIASGAFAGILTAASIIIGLETTPLLLVAALYLWVGWVTQTPGSDQRLLGYGLVMGLALAFGAIVFGGGGWRYPACDGFTERAWMLAQNGSFAAIALAVTGRSLPGTGPRLALSALASATLFAFLFPTIRACADPYSTVNPLVARIWLDNVGEAQGLFVANPATAIGYVGLMIAGLAASIWRWLRTSRASWAALIAVQMAALVLSCLQLRGAYAGAILAAPALAMVIARARQQGTGWLAAAWAASAGMLYPIAAQALALIHASAPAGSGTGAGCASPETIARLAVLPTGTLIAPIDTGPYVIAGTHHRVIAAPYHRNNAGNAAMYRFFAAQPGAARLIADRLQVDYVLYCPAAAGELKRLYRAGPQSLIGLIDSGHAPPWLQPVGRHGADPVIFRIERRLPHEAKPL